MRRRRVKDNGTRGTAAWMNTYADLVTLLLCFFVLLFSFSTIDVQKFAAIVKSFQGSLGILESGTVIESNEYVLEGDIEDSIARSEQAAITIELEEIASDVNEYLKEKGYNEQVVIQYNERYVKLSFLDGVLFDPGKAIIKEDAIGVLDAMADKLLEFKNNRIKIEGHTDTVPINTAMYPNNWYLSAARAIAVAEYYIDEKGFEPVRLSAEGFGEFVPIATNDTAEGRQKNRRVEIKILNSIDSKREMNAESTNNNIEEN